MSVLEFTIKHAGKSYEMKVDSGLNVFELKSKVEELTGVPKERQKYMVRGGLREDSLQICDFIKANSSIMMVGTPDSKLLSKPKQETRFLEDLSEQERSVQEDNLPVGLRNLGNTCYLNASLQALYAIEPLREKVLTFNGTSNDGHEQVVMQLKMCFNAFSQRSERSFTPIVLLTILRKIYPQFAEKDPSTGFYKQQDAEELFTQLIHTLQVVFGENLLQKFEIEFETTIRDTINENNENNIRTETDTKLQCHISGSTNFLKNGLLESLKEKIEKRSELTGENSIFEHSKRISKLPEYLTIQFVRFFWKKSTAKKSKILRKVQFPFQLDLADMLTPEYAAEKIKCRDDLRELDKKRQDQLRDLQENINDHISSSLTPAERHQKMLELEQSTRDHWNSQFRTKFPENLKNGENPSSLYDLIAVVTHQGANSDSGHYQAFIRDELNHQKWYKFNDDKISIISQEKVQQLAGGGESDTALILIYKAFAI